MVLFPLTIGRKPLPVTPAANRDDWIGRLASMIFSQPGQQPTHPQPPLRPMLSDVSTPDKVNVPGVFEHDSTDSNDLSTS